MAIDLSRVATKALETALEEERPRRHRSTVRAMAAGAALAVGARVAMSNKLKLLRHLPDLAELRDIPDRVRDRVSGLVDNEPDVDDLEPEDLEPEDLEPEAELDEEDLED